MTTERQYGFATDEATYVWVASETRQWFGDLWQQPLAVSFAPATIAAKWHFLEPPFVDRPGQPHSNFNLPVAVHLANIGWLATGWIWPERVALRTGSMALFSLTAGWLAYGVCRRSGVVAGIATSMLWVCAPRAFGHAHLACTETALACGAVLAVSLWSDWLDARPTNRGWWHWWIGLSIAWGFVLGTKLSAVWLLPAAVLALIASHPSVCQYAVSTASFFGAIGLVILVTPPLWPDPIAIGLSYINAARTLDWGIPTVYFGQPYTRFLPATSVVVLPALYLPVTTLLLAVTTWRLLARVREVRRLWLQITVLAMAWVLTPMPRHDADRPMTLLLALLTWQAALGLEHSLHWVRERLTGWTGTVAASILAVLVLAEPVTATWEFRDLGLQYYSPAVGGPTGANQLGFDLEYWSTSVRDEDWRRLSKNLAAATTVWLMPDHPGFARLRDEGLLPPTWSKTDPRSATVWILLAKRSADWARSDADGLWRELGIGRSVETAPGLDERRFEGIRLWVVQRPR